MYEVLFRRFVKNHDKTALPEVRFAYGNLSGRVGIAVNFLLSAIKLALGLMSGAVSVVADAVHNLADAAASIATLLGFRLAAKPADAEHPFGHGRIEYIAGFCIVGLILLIGFKLLEASVEKILAPEPPEVSVSMLVILTASIALQLWLGRFNKTIGERIDSAAIRAAAADSLNDCIATVVVVASLAFHYATGIDIDGWAGVLVALFILHSGWEAARDTLQPLLGQPPDPALVEGIEKTVLKHRAITGVHDIIIHDYGPGRIFASVHAEVPASMDFLKAHEIIDGVEELLRRKYHIIVTVHMDPVVTDDPEVERARAEVEAIMRENKLGESIHDFRMTTAKGGGKKLIFDVEVAPACKMTNEDVRFFLTRAIEERHPIYHPVIRVDRFFC